MKKLFIISIYIFVVTVGSVFGQITPPPVWNFTASMPGVGDEEVVLFVLPDGNGSSFYNAQVRDDGSNIDAHIELLVLDGGGFPIPNYPKEDMWLESIDGGMVPCYGGTCADADTDENGLTLWETPLHAGGHSDQHLQVLISGNPSFENPLSMLIVSADINGDGSVNLIDVGTFSTLFFNGYAFGADFFADGVLNLADIGRLAIGKGGSCP